MSEPDIDHSPDLGALQEGRLVGKPVRRVEDARLLAGLGRYVDDRPSAHALHMAVFRSDQAHARVDAIRTDAARALPGVRGVYVWQDIAGLIKPALATSRMSGYQPTPIHALANGVVHFVGEPVVAVLADSRYIAEDALDLIEVHYTELPVATDPEVAAQPGAPLLHATLKSNVLVERAFARGEVDEAFNDAPHVISGR